MNGKFRIGLVGNQAFTLIRFRGPLIRALVSRGHSVFAFMPDASEADCDAVRALGAEPVSFKLDRTGLNPLKDLYTIASLVKRFRRCEIDLVFCYFIKPVIYGLWAARLSSVKQRFALIEGAGTAFADEDNLSLKRRALTRIVIQLYRYALRGATKVFFLNQDDRRLFQNTGMAAADKCRVVPGIGIDLRQYDVADLPTGATTFVMLSRLLGEKGVREYAAAVRMVKRRYPESRFILLGGLETNPDGIDRNEVQSWVDDGILEWPGRVDNVQGWLAAAHVFVLPSYYREGLPRSTMEAMAVGRAIITTDSVGCRETVRHNENGLIVPPRDVEALAAAMMQMLEAPECVGRMGKASRLMAEERFDVRVINQMFMAEMGLSPEELVEEPGKRD